MRSRVNPRASLMLLAIALTVSACAGQGSIRPILPSAADLADEPKPAVTPAVLTDSNAAAEYDSAIEAWGERGWATVARICRWARAHGSRETCPPPPD